MRAALRGELPGVEILNPRGSDGKIPSAIRGRLADGFSMPPTEAVNTRSWDEGFAESFNTLRAQYTGQSDPEASILRTKDLGSP